MKYSGGINRGTSFAPSLFLGALLLVLCALPVANVAGPVDESLATPRAELGLPGRLAYPTPRIRRDPFVSSEDVPVAGGLEQAVAGIVLPANAGASQMGPAAGAVVRGVLLGAHPAALVEIGGRVESVRVGSPLLGSSVASIDANGVALEDGETLRFPVRHP